MLDGVRRLELPDGPPLLVLARSRHAVAELALHDAGRRHPARHGAAARAGVARRPLGGRPRHPGRGREAVGGLDRLRHPEPGAPLGQRRDGRAGGGGAGRRRGARRAGSSETHATSADGTTVRMFVLVRRRRRRTRARPCSTATAASTSPGPRPTARRRWPGSRPGGVWVVANLRGGSEEGEAWHRAGMRGTSRTCSTTSRRRPSSWSSRAGRPRRPAGRSWAGPTAGCWSARCSPSAPTSSPPSSAARRCWTWSATSSSGWAAPGTTSTAPPPTRTELGWLLAYSPYHRVRAGTAYPAVLFTRSSPTPGSTRCTPASCRRAAARHDGRASRRTHPAAPRAAVGHGARAVSRTVGLAADQLAFLAAHTGAGCCPHEQLPVPQPARVRRRSGESLRPDLPA